MFHLFAVSAFVLIASAIPTLWLGAELVVQFGVFPLFPLPALVCVALAALCIRTAEAHV